MLDLVSVPMWGGYLKVVDVRASSVTIFETMKSMDGSGRRLRVVFAIFALSMLWHGDGSMLWGDDPGAKGEDLRKTYEAASLEIHGKADKERSDLGAKYLGALERLEADLQAKGILENLLAVRKERETFAKSGMIGSDSIPELIRLRTVYQESLAPIRSAEEEASAKLRDAYVQRLESLQVELTRAGDVETAVKVKSEADTIRQAVTVEATAVASNSAAGSTDAGAGWPDPVPEMQHAPLGGNPFKLNSWPLKTALPSANYRISGQFEVEEAKGQEIQLLSGSVFRGADEKASWLLRQSSVLVARDVQFNGFLLLGDLNSRFYFEKCQFKDMNLRKGGAWFGGRFMSRWQFRDCRIEGSLVEDWSSRKFGIQMVACQVERVKFPSIQYDEGDEPSEVAGQSWARVRNTHFRKCVIPVSVLSLLDDCSFEECRFVDDLTPLTFTMPVARTVYLQDCKWEIKALPDKFTLNQKKLSEKP